MVIPKASKKWDILFFILLIGISFLYSYNIILWMRPYSIHQWRQCDCLSFALNYYKEGMHFFTPSLHSCGGNGNGITCPTEFPVLYYIVALLWKIFGYHEFIFRLLDVLISFAGLYALFKITRELVQDGAWALMVSLFLFTSPVFAVYSNNFITDAPALSIVIIAWYFFISYYKSKRLLFFYISILFFLLAGLIKITALLSFVPLMAILAWELFRKNKTGEKKLFTNPFRQGIALLFLITGMVGWIGYSTHFRNNHNPGFFLTVQHPVWAMDRNEIRNILITLYNTLLPQYFSMSVIFFTLTLFLALILNFKKVNRFYFWFLLMIFAGCILYFAIWFDVFTVHDYYLIVPLIFVPVTFIAFLVFLKENYAAVFNSPKLKIVFAIILFFNVYYCSVQINLRYPVNTLPLKKSFIVDEQSRNFWNWFHWDYENHKKAFETITPYIRSIGISREDKVISLPDETPIISLYLMDQKGFTNFGFNDIEKGERIKKFISLGAKYLLISDASLLDSAWMKPYLKNKIGTYQNVSIYDLRAI